MQNAGQQYGQGGASSHQTAPFNGHSETTTSGGSITSSLRQFRRKNEDKQSQSDGNTTSTPSESHVARVAPHSHYPPRPTAECFRYPPQYPDYGLQQPVKYSEISEPHPPLQDHISPSVIQKAKSKEYMEMCNVQQTTMKPAYDHLNGQQTYPDANVHPHAQYLHKEPQVHHGYKPESQYYHKDPQYSPQFTHQLAKYPQMPSQVRKYPPENDFLSKLRRIHPTMARSIMSDHHHQESQSSYQAMDQNRYMNQRYMNYPSGIQNNTYTHGYMPYPNYQASCSYNRPPQMTPRFAPVNANERSISPKRGYPENMGIPMNYGGITSQKISPNYPQYNTPEYAQHYQHRRAPLPQDYYQQHCRAPQYLPHQMSPQEMAEGRVTVSDSIKHYIENWADEETASEMNQLENSRLCKENIRGREDQTTETVYMINASELQYLENEIPLVTSESGLPVVASESGQYIIKSGVSIVNGSEMMRIVEKTGQVEIDHNGERVVNLHIMDTTKPDCMLANKPNELNQRQPNENAYPVVEKPRVVVHQNTVIATGAANTKVEEDSIETPEDPVKIGTSLPIISDTLEDEMNRTITKECRKETADKNCSPINLDQLENYRERENNKSSGNSLVEEIASIQEITRSPKNLPLIDAHLKKDDSKTDNKEHQGEFDDPHKHIDTLLEDTIATPDVIDTPIQDHLLEEHTTQSNTTNEDKSVQIISKDSLLVQETTKTDETEESNINQDNLNEKISYTPNNEGIEAQKVTDKEKMDCEQKSLLENQKETIDKLNQKENDNKGVENQVKTTKNQNETDNTLKQNAITCKIEKLNEKNTTLPKSIIKKSPKRSRRIFSVDDIMNNIGKKTKQSDSETLTRRHSLQTTKEFLDKETRDTFLNVVKETKKDTFVNVAKETKEETTVPENVDKLVIEDKNDESLHTEDNNNKIETNSQKVEMKEIKVTEKIDELNVIPSSKIDTIIESNQVLNSNESTICGPEENSIVEKEIITLDPLVEAEVILEDNNHEITTEVITETQINSEETTEKIISDDDKNTENIIPEEIIVESEENSMPAQPDVQYRNVIRVEESSVLLEIAGELVEINVNNVNGKNIITVVPLSDTAVVDFNDNYEAYDNSEAADPLRLDEVQDNENLAVMDLIEDSPDPEVVETTGEIIIGMDLSLEEEIKLDVDQPPVIFTKAAKKAYDCDLQIPSITTSEDVLDNSRSNSYTSNDKVSSTKEKSNSCKNKKKSSRPDSSKTIELPKRFSNKPDKKSLFRDLIAARNRKKQKQESTKPEDDDFVPFKELIRARKLKKLKLLKMKNNDDSRVDSTIKIDETCKETEIVVQPDKSDDDAEKKLNVQPILKISSEDETKPKKSDNDVKKIESQIEQNVQPKIVKIKRVSFSDLSQEIDSPEDKLIFERRQSEENIKTEMNNYKLEDPRLSRQNGISKSAQTKKKLSLEEYNKRKRKVQEANKLKTEELKKIKIDRHNSMEEFVNIPEKINPHRPKSLDDLNMLKSKECCLTKRKLSVEYSPVQQNYFDWEETQSPKMNTCVKDQAHKFCEFKGLISESKAKPKIVIDVNDLNPKPSTESSEDEILQNYKVQVESKLSTLNIQIPRPKPMERHIVDPFSKPETNTLIDRFLKNEKLSSDEMEKIRKIICYKRMAQQFKKIKSPDLSSSPINPAYELRKEERETKLLLKKMRDKKKARFRNLNSHSDSESEDDFREEPRRGDYSVVQSNCLAGVVPKLIIKRKTEMPLPIVRLERLDLGRLDDKNGRYAV